MRRRLALCCLALALTAAACGKSEPPELEAAPEATGNPRGPSGITFDEGVSAARLIGTTVGNMAPEPADTPTGTGPSPQGIDDDDVAVLCGRMGVLTMTITGEGADSSPEAIAAYGDDLYDLSRRALQMIAAQPEREAELEACFVPIARFLGLLES
jgi:hypothetical protein